MEELYKSLDEVIQCIVNSSEYQQCLKIKEQMSQNQELTDMIQEIKLLQKKYIRSHYDSSVKEKLIQLEQDLNQIPIYVIYLQNLDIVNQKIEYVKDSLNDYFYHLFNN